MNLIRPFCVAAFLLLAGCAPTLDCQRGAAAVSATLYFGREQPGGLPITDAEWRDFLAREVTPRFPDGLTAVDGSGQWLNPRTQTVTHQPSTVLTIVTAPGPAALGKLDAITVAYKAAFHQQSVGIVLTPVCASF